MASQQLTTPALTDSGLSQLSRLHAVERHAIESEIQTLIITANYARDFLTTVGMGSLPEDFFTCVEELKEVLDSIDLKSLDFEQRALTLKRTQHRMQAEIARQNSHKEA